MANGNNLFTLGLNVSATKAQMDKQLKQIVSELSNQKVVQITGGLNLSQTQNQIQRQLDTISRNLKVNIQIDTNAVNQQIKGLQSTLQGSTKGVGAVKVPFQFDLSDAKAVKAEINKIVSDITNNQGQLVKYKINVDENGQATKALLTYRNELNEVTNATLKLKTVGQWYDINNMKHNIVTWAEGQKTLSQNIEATTNANKRQIESDNQVIRKKAELIAQMNLLNTQAQKSGMSLNSDNQNKFNNLSINTSTLEDIKQLESYLRLARIEYQTLNAEISKGTHASSLETMKNTLQGMPNDIALLEARFNSIKIPDGVRIQIEQLKADMEGINSITDPQAKIQKYNEMITSLQNLQKQFQVTNQEQKNVNAGLATMQGASTLSNNIISWMAKNTDAVTKYDMELKQMLTDLQSVSSKTDLTRLQQQFRNIQSQVRATNNVSQSFFGGLRTQLTDALTVMFKYQLAYKIINKTIQAIKSLINAVGELDANLTEFNKVADLSTKEISKFADKAFQAAEKIGRTGSDMIEAATEFKRAGYTLEESLNMGSAALVMTNVAEGIDTTSESASTLISVLKGFNIDETDIMSIVDKINNVSNKSPVGFDNLADGLERVSGTMNQAGNSINETIGLLTGGFTQLRNMEKVSTGLITISQRLRAVDEDGESIDGLSAELEKSFGSIGVAIEDANGDLRSTYDIISDYAKVFPTLTSEQKQLYGEMTAGKRQIPVWNAMVQEIQGVNTAIEQSVDSVGAAETENEIYRQSIQGLKNEWDNAVEKFATEAFNSDWIKDFISAGTDLVKVLTNIVSQDDLASGTIGLIASGFKDLASILKELTENDFIGGIIKGIITLKTITTGIKLFDYLKVKAATQSGISTFFSNTTSCVRSLNGELVATQEASVGATTGMKALSLATNLGAMIAVTATIKALQMAFDKLNDTVEENQQRIDDINSSLSALNDEYITLQEKSKNDGLTEGEKDRLDYLERRLEIENELLKIEQKKLAKNTVGTSWTDMFDSESMASKQSKAENDLTLSSNRDEATYAIGYINNIQDRIAKAEQEKANAMSTGLKEIYQDRIAELTNEETKYLNSLSQKYDTFYEKKAEYEENAMQLQSVIDEGLLSGEDLETAKQRLAFFQSEVDSLGYLLEKTDLLTGKFDFDLDGLSDKLNNISPEDLLKNFSNEELKVLVGLDFDKDASVEDLKYALEEAQGLADDTKIKLEPLSTSGIISSMAVIKDGFSSLGKALDEFKENGVASSDTLSALNETFGKMDGYDNFLNVLGNSNSTFEEAQNAVSSLATEYLSSQNIINNCTDSNKNLIVSQLKSIGVSNAEEVVTASLSSKIDDLAAKKLAASTPNFANMTAEEIAVLATHANMSEHAGEMLNYLAIQKTLQDNDGFSKLTTNETNRLLELASAANLSAESIKTVGTALKYKKGIEDANANGNMKLMEYYERQINAIDTSKITPPPLTLPPINYVKPVSYSGGSKSGSGTGSKSGSSPVSSKATEPYKAEINTLQDLEDAYDSITLAISRNEIVRKSIEGNTDKELELDKQKIDLLVQQQKALNNLNNTRRKLISGNVSKLSSLGFDVSYNSANNKLQVKNLSQLNKLKGKDTEATNTLIKETEELIKTTNSLNKENIEASTEWANITNKIAELKDQNFSTEIDKWEKSLDGLNNQNTEIEFSMSLLEDNNYDEKIKFLNQKMINAKKSAESYKNEIDQLNATTPEAYKSTSNYAEEIADLTEKFRDAATNAFDYEKSIRDVVKAEKQANLSKYTQQKSDVNELIDMVKELIKQQSDDEVEALQNVSDGYEKQNNLLDEKIKKLEEEKDTYKKIIDAQKESLDLQKDQHDEAKQIAEYNKTIADIQNKLSTISNDNSREGIAKRQELEEKLADAQVDLQEYVYDQNIEKQKDALDTEYSLYENSVDKKIGALKEEQDAYNKMIDNIKSKMTSIQNEISNNTELTRQAIDMIDNDSGDLYNKLLKWNDEYGTSIDEDVTSAWESAQEVLSKYSDTMEGLVDLTKEMNSLQSDVNSMDDYTYDYSKDIESSSKTNTSGEMVGVRKYLVSKGFKVEWDDDKKQVLVDDKAYKNTSLFDNRDGTLYGTEEQIYKMLQDLGLYRGSFDTGGTIGNDGWAKVHKDETILTASNSDRLNTLLERYEDSLANLDLFSNPILSQGMNYSNMRIPQSYDYSNIQPSTMPSINVSYDSLINVQGSIDKDNVAEVKSAVNDGIKQLKQDWANQFRRNGITPNVKSRFM